MSEFTKDFAKKSPSFQRSYLRKVYLMAEEGKTEKICNTLTKFDFLHVKISHNDFGVQSLILDYDLATNSNLLLPDEQVDTLRLIQGAIRMSANALADDKNQLAGQLMGRLQHFATPEIKTLLTQAKQKEAPILYRVRASQSALTKGFEKKHHVFIIHCSPFSFLSQATLDSSFLIYSFQGHPSDHSQVSRDILGPNARSIFIESDI